MSQATPPQVPDFFSCTMKELKTHLLTYGVSASKDMSKESLANKVKKHYITETLPGLVKNHPGFLNYQGNNICHILLLYYLSASDYHPELVTESLPLN